MRQVALALAAALLVSCTNMATPQPRLPEFGTVHHVTPDLHVRRLTPRVWLHTTYRSFGEVRVPSNGLIVEGDTQFYLVDSAWGEEETLALVDWLGRTADKPLTHMVSTHHHEDRLSGSGFLQELGVRVVAHPLTGSLAAEDGMVAPESLDGLSSPGAAIQFGPLEIFYPGAAHAIDNLVVWIASDRLLFGGCAVRPGETSSPGNTDDADVASWPAAIKKVLERYPSAEVVVPGHGPPGGTELLAHTIAIFRAPAR